MINQTVLPVSLPDYATFENFLPAANERSVVLLKQLLTEKIANKTCYIWGETGTGKTHLLYSACKISTNSAYIPLKQTRFQPEALDGLDENEIICIDDVQAIATQSNWERSLMMILTKVESTKKILLFAGSAPPQELGFELRDLTSRFCGLQLLKLRPVNDTEKSVILIDRAARRGITIDETVARYILNHHARNMHSLISLLDRIDDVSLKSQRKVTIPFLKNLEEFDS